MKKLVTLLHCVVLLLSTALAQQDIYVNGKGPVLTIGTSLAWGSSGRGSVNNNYIFTPQQPQQNICVYVVNNNPTSSHAFTLLAYQSGDPTLRSYSTVSGRYSQNTVQTVSPISVSASSTFAAFIHIDAAATVAINIAASSTQAGSPDTADIYAVQTTSEHCAAVSSNPQIQASASSSSGFAAASHNTLVTGVANQKIYVTALGASTRATITTTGAVLITSGPSGCASNNRQMWAFTPNTATGTNPYTIGNGNGLLMVTNAGDSLCVDTSNLTGGTIDVNVSFLIQ